MSEHKWRRLDNSAKIFPIAAGKKYSTVFRYSITLKDNIKSANLEKALIHSLNKYRGFKVRLRAGFFWHYLDENEKVPIVTKECDYPCKFIDPRESKEYLFRVTYCKNKINIDFNHALTDGSSALEFVKEIVYSYIEITHPEEFKKEARNRDAVKIDFDTNDDFLKNYDKTLKEIRDGELAYNIPGTRIPMRQIAVIHEHISVVDLKKKAKEYGVTVTQYLTAILILAIKKSAKAEIKRPIKICIPVNLKRFFESKTMSNFFSYFTVLAHIAQDDVSNIEKAVELVHKQFEEKLTKEQISRTMTANIKLGKNLLLRNILLPFKKLFVRIAYILIRKYTTITYSNIGRLSLIKKYQEYVDHAAVMIAPEPVEKIKVSSCSYKDDFVISFTTNMKETAVERIFCKLLESEGLKVGVESNIFKPRFGVSPEELGILKTEYPTIDEMSNKIRARLIKSRNIKFIEETEHDAPIEHLKKRLHS